MVRFSDGLVYRPQRLGRSRLLRWDEIRLFEVEQSDMRSLSNGTRRCLI